MAGRGKKKINFKNISMWYFGVYLRRSFDDLSDKESNTITNQRNMLTDYLSDKENAVIVNYYIDDGYTGTNFERPGFKEMFDDVVSGKINAIIVKDLSRLGRNYIEVGKYIEDIFPIYNLRIIAINDDVDSYLKPESLNSLIVPIKNLMNENYSKDISNKVSTSYEAMAKRGLFIAGTPPYGYKIDPDDKHHLIIDEEEAKNVKLIFEMAANGDGRIKICKYLNENGILCRHEIQRRKKYNLSLEPFEIENKYNWGTTTIGRMLKCETYIGNLTQLKTKSKSYKDKGAIIKDKEDWVVSKNTHEPIIDKELFKRVQISIKDKTVKTKKPQNFSVYNGVLKCADCGRAMLKQEDHRGNRELIDYVCTSFTRAGCKCSRHKISAKFLDEAVLETIKLQIKLVIDLERSLTKLNIFGNYQAMEEEFRNSIKLLEKKKYRLEEEKREKYEDWKFEKINKTDFLKFSESVKKQIEEINDEMEIYKSNYLERLKKIKKNDYWINHFKRNKKIKRITKEVINELIDKIYVYENSKIKIVFKYQDEFVSLMKTVEEGSVTECQSYGIMDCI